MELAPIGASLLYGEPPGMGLAEAELKWMHLRTGGRLLYGLKFEVPAWELLNLRAPSRGQIPVA